MPDIRNELALRAYLEKMANFAIDQVTDKILKVIQDSIQKNIYDYPYSPNAIYYSGTGKPTRQFISAFKWDSIRNSLRGLTTQLYYDYSDMSYDPSTYLHGSYVSGDVTANLADILNVEGFTSRWNWKMRKPYWDLAMKELFDSHGENGLNRMFDDAISDAVNRL